MSVYTDAYAAVNDIINQLSGGTVSVQAVDTSSFIAVGNLIMQHKTDNIYNAITSRFSKTIFAARRYESYRFKSVEVEEERWGEIARKISFRPLDMEASQDWNTDISPTQLADGGSIDPFKIRKAKPVEFNFSGSKPLQSHITHFRNELESALLNESEFMTWYDGKMIEYYNDITQKDEAEREATVLNFIGGTYAMSPYAPTTMVDLVAGFNTHMGTSYTRAQILSTYFEDFLKWAAAEIQNYSKYMRDRTYLYHANVTGLELKRHTPDRNRKMIILSDFLSHAKAEVYSGLFNPEYLQLGSYEEVNFWQNPAEKEKVIVKPTYLDVSTGTQVVAGANVTVDYVVGLMFDEEALVISNKRENAVSMINGAGNYTNDFIHWLKRYNNDFTENHILFILGAGGNAKESTKKASKAE